MLISCNKKKAIKIIKKFINRYIDEYNPEEEEYLKDFSYTEYYNRIEAVIPISMETLICFKYMFKNDYLYMEFRFPKGTLSDDEDTIEIRKITNRFFKYHDANYKKESK